MTDPVRPVHIAGLLVSAVPGQLGDLVGQLAVVPGLQVHARDDVTGRVVVTLETDSINEQEAQFTRVRTLCGVRAVDLVYYVFDHERM